MKEKHADFFDTYSPKAKEVLMEILQKYEEHGINQFTIPDVLKVQPISNHGNINEIIDLFGDVDSLKQAFAQMQNLIYSD